VVVTQVDRELRAHQPPREVVATIGVFDGVHVGHQQLFSDVAARAEARGCLSCVVTLHPSPVVVLRPNVRPAYLCSLEERFERIAACGIDLIVPLTFTREVSLLDPRQFLGLVQRDLRLCELVEGPDFALGHNRAGTLPVLKALGEEMGFDVRAIDLVRAGLEAPGAESPISSTAIRQAVQAGEVATAGRLLGRPYRLSGEVVGGAKRGRAIGYPTANVRPAADRALPPHGIYVTRSWFGGHAYPSVTNIGTRPTFEDGEVLIEAFLLDFEGDLYGQTTDVDLLEHLRPELRFDGLEPLLAQMADDVRRARAYHAAHAR
jgi:riboflavin kinase/FMN adenylyltransferase